MISWLRCQSSLRVEPRSLPWTLVVRTAKGRHFRLADFLQANNLRLIESMMIKLDALTLELLRSGRIERRLDRLDKEQERDNRLETIRKEVGRISEFSGRIMESTTTLATDLKTFSVDVSGHLKEIVHVRPQS